MLLRGSLGWVSIQERARLGVELNVPVVLGGRNAFAAAKALHTVRWPVAASAYSCNRLAAVDPVVAC